MVPLRFQTEVPDVASDTLPASSDTPQQQGLMARRTELAGGVRSELWAQQIVTRAVRAMCRSEEVAEVVAVLIGAARDLGGQLAGPQPVDGRRGVPIDLGRAGVGPLVALADPEVPGAARQLQTHLPGLIEDARHAVARIERGDRLRADAEHDALTGLFNRRAYNRLRCRLGPGDVVVLLDLDGFKAVNDRHGHAVGDQVLRVFGSVLHDEVRVNEHAVRLGGDEFLVVLQDATVATGEHFVERLRIAWRQRRPLPVEISVGIAVIEEHVDAAIETADQRLYAQKRDHCMGNAATPGVG